MSTIMAKCIDCYQQVIIVEPTTVIIRPELFVDMSNAYCEGCFKWTAIKYMCLWGHFTCEDCSHFDPNNKCVPSPIVNEITKSLMKKFSKLERHKQK